MPVTIVPAPRMVKTSSTHTRNTPLLGRSSQALTTWFSASKNPSNPSPVMLEIGQMGALGQKRPGQEPAQIRGDLLAPSRLDQVNLGQGHQPVPHAHQREDVQVLVGLRHDAVIGRDDEDHHIHAMRPGHHVADEVHMPGHVHDAHDAFIGEAAGSEAQVYGQAALLFLGQRVGLAAGEELDERGLAVVHVPGGAEHDVLTADAHGGEYQA